MVWSARQAVDLLGAGWAETTPSAKTARSICVAVLSGHLHPKLARGAFHRAALEARLLIAEPTEPATLAMARIPRPAIADFA